MTPFKKPLKNLFALGGLIFVATSANAQSGSVDNKTVVKAGDSAAVQTHQAAVNGQSATVGNNAGVKLGTGAAAAHADQATVGVKDGNINVSVTDVAGVRIGDNKVVANTSAKASVPVTEVLVPGSSVITNALGIKW